MRKQVKKLLDWNNQLNRGAEKKYKNRVRKFRIRTASCLIFCHKEQFCEAKLLLSFKSHNSATRNLPKSDTGLKFRGIVAQHGLKFGKLEAICHIPSRYGCFCWDFISMMNV